MERERQLYAAGFQGPVEHIGSPGRLGPLFVEPEPVQVTRVDRGLEGGS